MFRWNVNERNDDYNWRKRHVFVGYQVQEYECEEKNTLEIKELITKLLQAASLSMGEQRVIEYMLKYNIFNYSEIAKEIKKGTNIITSGSTVQKQAQRAFKKLRRPAEGLQL